MATEPDAVGWLASDVRSYAVGTLDEGEKIATIRAELPALKRYVYLNAGTNGPMPRRAHEALIAQAERELVEGRIVPDSFPRLFQARDELKAQFAALLGCAPDEIALTHNTTEGMNIALMGLDWRPGDEIVTARRSIPAACIPLSCCTSATACGCA